MKNFFLISALLTVLFSVNSCRKCYTCRNICSVCTKEANPTQTVCKNDFTFSMDYEDEVSLLTGSGYSCQTVTGNLEEEVCGPSLGADALRLEKEDRGFTCTTSK